MRILLLTALALGLACALVVGAASATAQETDDTLDELSSAGIPLLNSPPAPAPRQVPPGQPGPDGQLPPDTLVDLPIPDPTDWIPDPLDWLPGGLNPVNWAKDIVNAVFTLIGQAMLEAIRGFVDWALGMGGSSLNFVTRTPAEGTYDSPTVRSLYDFSRARPWNRHAAFPRAKQLRTAPAATWKTHDREPATSNATSLGCSKNG